MEREEIIDKIKESLDDIENKLFAPDIILAISEEMNSSAPPISHEAIGTTEEEFRKLAETIFRKEIYRLEKLNRRSISGSESSINRQRRIDKFAQLIGNSKF